MKRADEAGGETTQAYLLLNAVAVLYGSQHAILKDILDNNDNSPGTLNFVRFAIAAAAFSPWLPVTAEGDYSEEGWGLWAAPRGGALQRRYGEAA